MNSGQAVKLSKLMSYALRHDPESFGLVLDKDGWVRLDYLVEAIAARPRWDGIRGEQVLHVTKISDKKRFEIQNDLLRARYGHSRAARPEYKPVKPPPVLLPRHSPAIPTLDL